MGKQYPKYQLDRNTTALGVAESSVTLIRQFPEFTDYIDHGTRYIFDSESQSVRTLQSLGDCEDKTKYNSVWPSDCLVTSNNEQCLRKCTPNTSANSSSTAQSELRCSEDRGKSIPKYKCEICQKWFSSLQAKGGHAARVHPGMSTSYNKKCRVRKARAKLREARTKAKQ